MAACDCHPLFFVKSGGHGAVWHIFLGEDEDNQRRTFYRNGKDVDAVAILQERLESLEALHRQIVLQPGRMSNILENTDNISVDGFHRETP